MTPAQVQALRASWALVEPIGDEAARLFYARLFELDPSLRRLFSGDMAAQGRKLLAALRATVAAVDRFDALRPMLADLGARHRGYGVRAEHYDTVGAALLWTLQRGLQQHYCAEVDAAWRAAYGAVAQAMQATLQQPAQA
ncbi:MAG: globin family protein [Pseudomonadota bacterium]